MKWFAMAAFGVVQGLILCAVTSCTTVPITGRQQLNLVPAHQLMSMSLKSYDEFLATHKKSTDTEKTALVQRTGHNIQYAVERYLSQVGQSHTLDGYEWEFNLVEDKAVNAWCMPGGKVVVYTGLLPVARDETGLAVVMGHEIAHAVANHGNERMSQQLAVQMGGVALSAAMSNKPQETRQIFLTTYGLGATVGLMLPYSRMHEKEADRLGLIFMAMAGFDPSEAVEFWERMAADKSGKTRPEFLSTHPSDQTRIASIKALIPEAMEYYNRNKL